MSKKTRYHLTITDNVTGEVVHEKDVGAIIAAVHSNEGTGNILLAWGISPLDLAAVVEAAFSAEAGIRKLPKALAEAVIASTKEIGEDQVTKMLKRMGGDC